MKEENVGFSISAEVELNAEGTKEIQSLMKELDEKESEERHKVDNLLNSHLQEFVGTNSEVFANFVKENGKKGEDLIHLLVDVFQNALAIGWNTCYGYYKEKIEKV